MLSLSALPAPRPLTTPISRPPSAPISRPPTVPSANAGVVGIQPESGNTDNRRDASPDGMCDWD